MVKNEMIERGALAIKAIVDRHNAADHNFRFSTPDEIMEGYRAKARAVIEAMREPTEAMLAPEVVSRTEARLDGTYPVNYLLPIMDIWPQMIDAALSEDGS